MDSVWGANNNIYIFLATRPQILSSCCWKKTEGPWPLKSLQGIRPWVIHVIGDEDPRSEKFLIGDQINQPCPKPQPVDNPPHVDDGGQPPSFGCMRLVVNSQNCESRDMISTDGQPPSLNALGGQISSQSGGSIIGGNQTVDPEALVGMTEWVWLEVISRSRIDLFTRNDLCVFKLWIFLL